MPTLREMQAEWNALVPQAQALGVRRVRLLNLPLETKEYRAAKLAWLRGELERLSATTALSSPVAAPAAPEMYDISIYTFGVELEFIAPIGVERHELARRITQAGVQCNVEGYGHAVPTNWKIVTDGSLGDYTRGSELVSPVLRGVGGLDQLTIACNVLKEAGCKITQKCGYHVHVGAQGWDLQAFKNLVMLYRSSQAHIDTFMAPSRRASANGYCQAIDVNYLALERATTIESVASAFGQSPGRNNVRGGGRYKKLNYQSYWQHGTVEFRHHQGTVEAAKAVNWAKLCMRMCAAAQDGARASESLEHMLEVTKASLEERTYFRERVQFFRTQEQRAAQRTARAQRPRSYGNSDGIAVTGTADNPFTQTGTDLQRRAFGQQE